MFCSTYLEPCFSVENNWPLLISAPYPRREKFQLLRVMKLRCFLCNLCNIPIHLHRELWSKREVLCPTWRRSLVRGHFLHWTLNRSMKSRRASPVPLIFLPGTDCPVVPCYSSMQTRVFKSAVRNFLRAPATWESSTSLQVWNYSHHEKTTLSSSIFPGGIDFIDRHNSFCWKAGAGANATLEIHSPKSRLIQKKSGMYQTRFFPLLS